MHVHTAVQAIMKFFVLGPVELKTAGRQFDLGSVKAHCVLGILLLTLGTVMPADSLIERVWDGSPPAKAREDLSIYVTRLRKVLRQAGAGDVQLVPRAHGYVLDADPADVDLYCFRSLRDQSAVAAGRGDPERAVSLLREADALWRGQALAGLPGESVARLRQSLEEERWAALLERVEIELGLGRHAGLIGELQQLADRYPMDEAVSACHMLALYRSGRQSDALRIYRDTRSRLISEIGAEPGPVLSELHQQILRRDPTLLAKKVAQPLAGQPAPDTLPPGAVEFVGRARELALLTLDLTHPATVHLITGMPGVGKTALAIKAAQAVRADYPDGQLFLSFCSHDPRNPPLDQAGALHGLLRMLEVPPDQVPRALAERAALWRAELARRRMVVVLDDVGDLEQVRPLLPTAGVSRILITSRSRLDGLTATGSLTLEALADDDAAQLFTRITSLTGDSRAGPIKKIIRLCGGLPLAIQLTAHRLRQDDSLALGDLIEQLSQPPGQSAGVGLPDAEVAAAFELSYRALPVPAQRFFRLLGLHPGTDITAYAAAALSGASLPEAEAALAALLNCHLIESAGPSFRFHDLIRQYAATCATRDERASERRRAFDRVLDYYLFTADQADRVLYPYPRRPVTRVAHRPPAIPDVTTPERAAHWLELEWRNVLHAAYRAAPSERKHHAADLIRILAGFLEAAGHWGEAATAHAFALQASRDLDDQPGIAQASLNLSLISGRVGELQEAFQHAERAVTAYRSLNDQGGEAAALDQLGTLHRFSAQFREALAYHREAGRLFQLAADVRGVAGTLNHAGIACYHLGRYESALEHLQEALMLYRQIGDRRGEAKTLNNIGNMQRYQGYHRDALESYQSALKIFQQIGGERNQAILHENIGCIHHYKGNYEEALRAYRHSLAISRRIGNLPGEAGTLNEMGITLNAMENYGAALAHHEQAERIAVDLADAYERVIALRGVGDALRGQGRHDEALDRYQQALRLAREISEPYQEGKILEGIAETVFQTEGFRAARIYWQQALDIYQQLKVPEAESVRLRLSALTGSAEEIP